MLKARLEERLIVYLMLLKITPNLKGYTFIKQGTMNMFENGVHNYAKTGRLCQELSVQFNEKASLVDRALRHAVEVSYSRNGIRDFENACDLSFGSDKPTPKEIISLLAEKLILELKYS